MKTVRVWTIRVIIIALLLAAVIKSPTAFVSALVGLILAGYLIYLWLRWKFWRILSPLKDWNDVFAQTTLNLQPSNKPYHNRETTEAELKVLKQHGFTILGAYGSKQMATANIILANHRAEGIHALIMDIQYQGTITEFCTRYEDGKTFTYSNTKMPEFMPRPDTHPISRFPDADAQTLLREFKTARPQSGIYKIEDGDVKQLVESLYSELKVYALETMESTANTETQLLENFIIGSGWSAIEWHRKQNDIVIIHDKIKDYELISKYEGLIDDEDGQYQKRKNRVESIIKNNPPIEAFKILSAEIPTKIRLRKIHELTEPVLAHVYLKETAP